METITRGKADLIDFFRVVTSAGAAVTGLDETDFTVRYIKPGAVLSAAITTAAITAIETHVSPTNNGYVNIKEVSAANAPGLYCVHYHDDWFQAAGTARSLIVIFTPTTGEVVPIKYPLIGWDPQAVNPDVNLAAAGVGVLSQTNYSTNYSTYDGTSAVPCSDKTGFSLSSGAYDAAAAALLDLTAGVETGWTLREWLRCAGGVLMGEASGMSGTSAVFRKISDTGTTRVACTVDVDGNRSGFTYTKT